MLLAPSFRKRWDITSYAQSHERPFTWSDPASVRVLLYLSLFKLTVFMNSLFSNSMACVVIQGSSILTILSLHLT